MTNSINTSEAKPSNIIVLTFDESELEDIDKTDENDCTPKDLLVNFDVNCINKAQKIFKIDTDLNAIDYKTTINSKTFGGKLQYPLIQIVNSNYGWHINALFCNGYTGTSYELNITDKVLEALESDNTTA